MPRGFIDRTEHGMRHRPEYNTWSQIVQRCTNPRNKRYTDYGGRGITMCPRWRNSFVDFLTDVGPRPTPRHTIERMDNERGYEPGNCKWATPAEQNRNRRDTYMLTYQGVTACLTDWAAKVGIGRLTLRYRSRQGWPVEKILTVPPGTAKRTNNMLTHEGRTMCLTDWANELGIDRTTLSRRINRLKWPVKKALTEPVKA